MGGASIPRQWHGGPEMGSHVAPSPEEKGEEEEQDKEERREGRKEGGTGTALARPPTAGPPDGELKAYASGSADGAWIQRLCYIRERLPAVPSLRSSPSSAGLSAGVRIRSSRSLMSSRKAASWTPGGNTGGAMWAR